MQIYQIIITLIILTILFSRFLLIKKKNLLYEFGICILLVFVFFKYILVLDMFKNIYDQFVILMIILYSAIGLIKK